MHERDRCSSLTIFFHKPSYIPGKLTIAFCDVLSDTRPENSRDGCEIAREMDVVGDVVGIGSYVPFFTFR